jgi:PAS domain S-box-containing protein
MTGMSEERIRDVILDSIADGVFTVDEQWRITSFNRAAEEITGVDRERALGQKCFEVFQASICQTKCALRDTIDTGRRWVDQRIDILNIRGEQIPVSISTSVLRDEDGRTVGDRQPLYVSRHHQQELPDAADSGNAAGLGGCRQHDPA